MLEKLVALHTSRDAAVSECSLAASKAIARAPRFARAAAAHALAWRQLWRRFDVHLHPAGDPFTLNAPMLLRLNMFHLLQAASLASLGLDAGVPARGWTGEAYQGHVFWDELFIFPTLNLRTPEITRSLLMYRYRRLGEARAAARAAGHAGAMFPWQSGSDGQEETQALNLNPRSRRWMPDNKGIHLGAMAGTVDLVQRVSTGIEVTGDMLRLNPRLPEELERLDMRIRYRGHTLDLTLTRDALTIRCREPGVAPIRLAVRDQVHELAAGATRVFELTAQG